MSDPTVVIETAKHYVKFSRKVNDGAYGGTEAEILIAVPMPTTASGEELIETLQRHFAIAESMVFEQLGRDYTMNEQGVVVELVPEGEPAPLARDSVTQLRETFGGGELLSEREVADLNAGLQNNVVQGNFGAAANGVDVEWVKSLGKQESRDWAEARYATNPNEFWDNRANKRNPNAPDFKHKDTGAAFWLQKRSNG